MTFLKYCCGWILLSIISFSSYGQFVVTNTNDTGPGSLRAAVTAANASAAKETITFNISGAGPWQIDLQSVITIDNPSNVGMIIDGLTQPTSVFGTNNMVVLNGSAVTTTSLSIVEPNVEIYGLHIRNFNGHGLTAGTESTGLIIGAPGRGNVISGNSSNGIDIDGSANAIIQGNRIGTSVDGLAADGNQDYGIQARNANSIQIGGNSIAGEGNLISANGTFNHYAIHLRDASDAQVSGNLFGTDVNGDNDLGNRGGINVTSNCDNPTIGGSGAGQANVIAGCSGNPAILVSASAGPANQNVVIENNIIGLNAAGTTAIPNFSQGISLRSVNGVTSGNIIRDNTVAASGATGLEVTGFLQTNIIIENNKIGTDVNGNGGAVFGNNSAGMSLSNVIGTDNGANRVQILDNVIANSALNGLSIASLDNALIQRNYIGVEQDGLTPGPNTGAGIFTGSGSVNLEIGGIGNENVIAFNSGDGITFQSLAQTTAGTIIGVNSYFCNGDVAIDFTLVPTVAAPIITGVTTTDIDGTSTASDGSLIDIYEINPGCADNQGAIYIGQTTVSSGFWNYNSAIDDTKTYVATVTDVTNGISEFSTSFAPNTNFITTWSTTDTQITIPTTGGGYNYDITWTNLTNAGIGDGAITGQTSDYTITGLTNNDIYQVEISGTFPRIYFSNGSEALKILTIEQWGAGTWTSMQNAFYGCTNLTYNASDAPDLTSVTDMASMFRGATAFNGDISAWNVSQVVDFSSMFNGASLFNQPLNTWVLNTTPGANIDMTSMFRSTLVFNQDLNNWVTTEVADMNSMFRSAEAFNGNIDNWDVGKVLSMEDMFRFAKAFNRNISGWNVSNVQSMQGTFRATDNFDQDLSAWGTRLGNVLDMDFMFQTAISFNQNIGNWVVTSVTSMQAMFGGADSFNQDVSGWDVSNVTTMANMFGSADAFNQSLGNWDIGQVTDMSFMLNGTALSIANYDATLIGWESLDAGEVQIPTGVDLDAVGLQYCAAAAAHASLMGTYGWTINDAGLYCVPLPFVTTWSTTDTQITIPTNSATYTYNYDIVWTNLTNAGIGDGSTTGQTGDFTITGLTNNDIYQVEITGTFPHIYFNNGGDKEKILTVEQYGDIAWSSMHHAFYGCINLTSTASDAPDLSGVTVLGGIFRDASAFNGPMGNWDVSTITDMQNVFSGASSFNQNIGSWLTDNVTGMNNMFRNASAFNQDIGSWNTSGVFNMNAMFSGASSFNQDIDGWDVSNVFNFSFMFSGATSFNQDLNSWTLTNANNTSFMFFNASAFNGNISSWNPAGVTTMSAMFGGASAFNQNINSWNVGAVTDMGGMFQNATSFNQDLNSWIVNIVDDMSFMFYNCSTFDGDIGNWNVGAVTDMNAMFSGASSFNQNISSWTTGNVNSMAQMFLDASSFDQDISGWDVGTVSNMRQIFYNATSFNQNLNAWNVSSVTDLHQAFTGASAFNQSLSGWDVGNVTTMFSMLNSTALSIANYDATLIGWQALPSLQNSVNLGALGLEYCASESARAALMAAHLWVISGDSKTCAPEIVVFEGPTTGGVEIFNNQLTPFDLGSSSQGIDITMQFTIENQGGADLNISDITISGTVYSVVSAPSFIIASGNSEVIDIVLDASSMGTFDEIVTITSNDADESLFTFPITGTITTGTCVNPPTVSAGSDQSICIGTSITLTGAIGGGATAAIWTTNGTGTFDNDMILNATYTPSAVDETNGTITLTLTVPAAGFCLEVSDDLILTIPQPITAANPNAIANVQQVSTIDVLSGSSTNPGDVLTISILQNGTKGTAIINPDNTLSYTPDAGTVGSESFIYRICNQCNLCDDGTVAIDIANAAPVFTAPTVSPTVVAGQTITISIPSLVTDLNANIDLGSFTNFNSTSNASFTYDSNSGDLTLNYANASSNGSADNISFTICDQLNACVDAVLQVSIDGEITINNGISPNGDGMNDYFNINNIQFLEPNNKVTIFNRWGDAVFEQTNYNSEQPGQRFEGKQNSGKELSSGVYFYKIEFESGREELTGYLTIKK